MEKRNHPTVLCAPVAEVVDGDHITTFASEHIGEYIANDGGSQVARVEGFGNVRRTEFNNNLWTLGDWDLNMTATSIAAAGSGGCVCSGERVSVELSFSVNVREHASNEVGFVEPDVEESSSSI